MDSSRAEAVPPVEDADAEFELRPGWQWVRMGTVIKLWNGYAFKSGDFQTQGIPVIRIGDLQRGEVVLDGAACVSDAVAKALGTEFWIPPDALLIAMSGATTGKVAFNRTGTRLLLNQRVGRIEPFLMSVHFIRAFFETIIARNLSISFGTAIPNLSAQQINETVVPLPPLAEQYRIVAKVDALMTLCDCLEESLAAGNDTRRRLLDALLAEALLPREMQEQAA
jgi:type I restriction enzyme S subunit